MAALIRRVALGVVALAVCAGGVVAALLWHEGYRVYVVHTGSMTPAFGPGDVVVDQPVHGIPATGEVITFRHSARTSDLVTHRVVSVTPQGIHTKGDANPSADAWDIRPDQVRGRVVGRVPRLGYLLVYLRQPTGVASLLAAVAGVVLLWRLFGDPARSGAPANSARPRRARGCHRAPPRRRPGPRLRRAVPTGEGPLPAGR